MELRFAIEREAFWNQVIRGKYGEEQGGWSSKEAKGGYGVGLWKTLRKDWEVVKSRLFFVVGNEQRVKFWKDIWCGVNLFVFLFLHYLLWRFLRMLGLRMFGGAMRVGEVGARCFPDC